MAEFTCCECGRHVTSFGYGSEKPPEPPLCAACLMLPGWPDDPTLRAVIDKDGKPDDATGRSG